MKTFTELLTDRGLNAAEYQVAIRALEDKCEWSWGVTVRRNSRILDVALVDGVTFILFGWSVYEVSHGGVGYGSNVDVISAEGERKTLQSAQWRHPSDPKQDDPSLNFSKIIKVIKEGEKWDVLLG